MKTLLAAIGLILSAAPALAQPPAPAPAPVDYANEASWLCLPGRADACGRPLATAALDPGGYGPVGQSVPAADPPIDCFYVYPTVSRDAGINSDMDAGIEENGAAAVQFARFASVCRTFAPIYRSATTGSIAAVMTGQDPTPLSELRLWRRPCRLALLSPAPQSRPAVRPDRPQPGHDPPDPPARVRDRGEARSGADALGAADRLQCRGARGRGGRAAPSESTPLCTRAGQTGCVVTYVSFRAEAPPPAGALFGRAARPGHTVACTNPAALGSSASVPLDSYWFTISSASLQSNIAWSSEGPPPAPFLRTRGLVSARLRQRRPARLSRRDGERRSRRRAHRPDSGRRIARRHSGAWLGHPLVDVNSPRATSSASSRRRAPPSATRASPRGRRSPRPAGRARGRASAPAGSRGRTPRSRRC